MRHAIETAPKDGKVVILEHDLTGASDVAHWSVQAGEWVAENGEPSKITPTHWRPMPRDEYLPQDHDESSNSSQFEPSSPRARRLVTACLITVALIAAALIRVFFAQETLLPSDSRKTELLALRQAEVDRATVLARTQVAVQARQAMEASAPQRRQSLEKEPPREVLVNELSEARRAIEVLDVQLRAEAANSAQSLDRERQKAAALAQEAAAARQELTTSTAMHRQALDEERARSAALVGELTTAQREIETQAAQLKASEETGKLRQVSESSMTDLRQSLQQERDRTEAMARDIESARRTIDVRVTPEATVNSSISKAAQVIEAAAMAQPAVVEAQGSPEATRLIARARARAARSGKYWRGADSARARRRDGQPTGKLHTRGDV